MQSPLYDLLGWSSNGTYLFFKSHIIQLIEPSFMTQLTEYKYTLLQLQLLLYMYKKNITDFTQLGYLTNLFLSLPSFIRHLYMTPEQKQEVEQMAIELEKEVAEMEVEKELEGFVEELEKELEEPAAKKPRIEEEKK